MISSASPSPKRTYKAYREMLASPRWQRALNFGARPQRLLWASTGTKDPKASDMLICEGSCRATHGEHHAGRYFESTRRPWRSRRHPRGGRWRLRRSAGAVRQSGIDVDALAAQLQEEGAESFVKSWNELMDVIDSKSAALKTADRILAADERGHTQIRNPFFVRVYLHSSAAKNAFSAKESSAMTTSVETKQVLEPLTKRKAWKALKDHYDKIREVHLRKLFAADPERGKRLTAEAAGIFLDYSKNRITDETVQLLLKLAEESDLRSRIDAMFRGDKINVTEKRAVLHVALRAPQGSLHRGGRRERSAAKFMPCWTRWRISPIASAAESGKGIPGNRFATSSTSASAAPTLDP